MTGWLVKKFVNQSEDTGNPKVRSEYGKLSGAVGIFCNLILFAGKMIAAMISSSVSIMADAINNLSDASSSIISLLGFKMAEKPADEEHPYGHARYEYLSALLVAVIIMTIGFNLLESSVRKIINPADVEFGVLTASILVISILIKVWMTLFNKKIGKLINSNTLIATAADSRNDAIATSAVLVAAVVSYFTELQLDGWMGFFVALFILYSGFGLIKQTLDPLLGQAPDEETVMYIHDKIMSYPEVLGTHDLMIHDYGPGRKFASVHIEMAAEKNPVESHEIIDNIEKDFLQNDNINMIIHYDPIITDDTGEDFRHWLSKEITKIDRRLTVHDVKIVPGDKINDVYFDCVVPSDVKISEALLKAEICTRVRKKYPYYNCIITVDSSYASMPHEKV